MTGGPVVRLECATVNCHGASAAARAAAPRFGVWLAGFARTRLLDVVSLQELSDAHASAVRREFNADWRLVRKDPRPGADDNGLLVRRSTTRVVSAYSREMGGLGWRGPVAEHLPRSMAVAVLDCGITVAAVHGVPGVSVTPDGLRGKRRNVEAWVAYWREFVAWAQRRAELGEAWAGIGDLNERADVRGKWSPRWVAREAGGRARSHFIDGVIASRVLDVGDLQAHPRGPGMDHDPVTMSLTWDGGEG